jgi:Spy/CpxP family protein refolding chaperone
MTRKNLPIAFYLLLVFVSGSLVGALGYRTYNPPTASSGNSGNAGSGGLRRGSAEFRRQYIEEMRSRLKLTDDQVGKVTAILDQTDARFREVRERDNQLISQIREENHERVRTILTPEQIPEYEKLHSERAARSKLREQQNGR